MQIQRFRDPAAFLERASPFLLRAEAENHLILNIAAMAPRSDALYLAIVENAGTVVACAMRTPPHKAVISRGAPAALAYLADDLAAVYPDLSLVLGPEPAVADFAALWARRTGVPSIPGMRQRVLETREVVPQPRLPSGRFRLAEGRDLPVVITWCAGFIAEALPGDPTDPVEHAQRRVATRSLYVWEDGNPVSMAGWAGRTPRSVRVNLVYTPPEYRGRGYASACVARLTQHLLDEGLAFCCLFTDLANPTSNSIYQKIGYRPVCDFTDYILNSRTRESMG